MVIYVRLDGADELAAIFVELEAAYALDLAHGVQAVRLEGGHVP